jgi:hypothetical protein
MRFGSGVSVRELQSMAMVIAYFANIPQPSRSEKRNGAQLAKWFQRSWSDIVPWLPLVQLRDVEDRPIDAQREFSDKGIVF